MNIKGYPENDIVVEPLEYYVTDKDVNIYNFIRSDEIREYLKKEDYFKEDISLKFKTILYSLVPLGIKLEAYKKLVEKRIGTKEDINNIQKYIEQVEEATDIIKHPIFYHAIFCYYENEFKNKGLYYQDIELCSGEYEYTYNFDEIFEVYDQFNNNKYTITVDILSSKYYFNDKFEKPCKISIDFAYFNHKLKPYNIYFHDPIVYKVDDNNYIRYPLPFKNGDSVVLYNIFMERPIYGIIESELDGNNCWYHFLRYGASKFDYFDIDNNDIPGAFRNFTIFDSLYSKEYFDSYMIEKEE